MLGNLRFFSLISLLIIIVISVVAGATLKELSTEELVQIMQRNAQVHADGYAETVWKTYRDAIEPTANGNPAALAQNPQVTAFAQDSVRYFQHRPPLRFNLYNASGLLLLTIDTNPANKLAGDPSPDSGFVREKLKSIGTASRLGTAATAQGSVQIVQTLVPVRIAGAPSADAMLEIISDITLPVQKQADFQMYGTGGMIALFLLFLGVLFFSSRRAENIIAKQHEANMDLAAAAAAAQAENHEKSQFLANISHELRTPLNAIIGFSEIIKNELMPQVENKKYKDYISDINSSGVHLLSLINDILDYSKAEAGKLEMEVSEVNATKLIQNSMRLVEPRAEAAQVRLVEAMPKEQIIITTDSKKFKQILLNLLSNAVKFTPAGGEIRLSAWRDLSDDTVSFEVRDSGIGIAPKDISRAMSPFGQVDSALSRKYEGTGLGLPLTKKFVELMGGKFMIESELGKGTTITFTLPRELTEREGVIIKHVA